MLWLRHLLAVALLPFVVTVVVPLWLARTNGTSLGPANTLPPLLLQLIGIVALGIGLLLFTASLRRFAGEGAGTLAPWDPPRHLVVRGPYRYVRHPMISGVLTILIAESLVLLSWPHLGWASTFFLINALYIPLVEEPQLARRFGAAYETYRRHVPRLIPRLRPWDGSA